MNKPIDIINDMLAKAAGEESGSFRGGDPEEIQIKKEEKRQEQEASGALEKAAAGEEPGAFRGGDPEEIRIKREEKREEQEASGALEGDDEAEEASSEEIAEAEEEEKQKKEDAGKSLVAKAAAVLAAEVSPVDTFGDYRPRNANGDELRYFLGDEKYHAPSPIRGGDNQHKTWSEVIGTKIPMTDPIQEVRRQARGGNIEAQAVLAKSGLLELRYHRQWAQERLSKGVGDAPAKGPHKYVKRWWEGGQWNYEYDTGQHLNHGAHHSGKMDHHTLDVHPEFHERHPGASPEKAYQYSRLREIAEGGASHNIKLYNKKTGQVEDKVAHYRGSKKDADGNIPHDEDGMPITSRGDVLVRDPHPEGHAEGNPRGQKRLDGQSYASLLMRGSVSTQHDVDGNPWIHWRPAGKNGAGKPEVMYDPASRHSEDVPERLKGKMGQGNFRTLQALMDHIEDQVGKDGRSGKQGAEKERRERASVPKEERSIAYTWEPEQYKDRVTGEWKERTLSLAIERGEVGTWETRRKPIKITQRDAKGREYEREEVRTVREITFNDPYKRNKVIKTLHEEYHGAMFSLAHKTLKRFNLLGGGDEIKDRMNTLVGEAISHALESAVNKYDPNNETGNRFGAYLLGTVKNTMLRMLPTVMSMASRDHFDPEEYGREWDAERRRLTRRGASPEEVRAARESFKDDYQQQQASSRDTYVESQQPGISVADRSAQEDKLVESADRDIKARRRREGREAKPMTGGKRKHGRAAGPGMNPGRGEASRPPSPEDPLLSSDSPADDDAEMLVPPDQNTENAMREFSLAYPDPDTRDNIIRTIQSWDRKTRDEYFANPELPKWFKPVYNHMAQFNRSLDVLQSGFEAVRILKAQDMVESGPKYKFRRGEPGAHKYMWEDESGGMVQMTNAPMDHAHHDWSAGPPKLHPNEPDPEAHPHMFDHHGRKLHRAAPEGAEVEPNHDYNPHTNAWAQKYTDEEGNDHHITLHKDRVNDPRFDLNEDIRHVDAQLEKVREWYGDLLSSQEPMEQALGLMSALVDQAKMVTGPDGVGIADLTVGNVSKNGNVFKFSLKDEHGGKHVVSAVLDSKTGSVLRALAQGKSKGDYLFEVNGQRIDQPTFARTMNDQFGVSPRQFRAYHAAELFSKEFQKLVGQQKDLSPEHLHELFDRALVKVARMMGHVTNDPGALQAQLGIDPIVSEALFMSAIHQHSPETSEMVQKSYKLHGKMVFQGMPISIENRKGSTRKWYDEGDKKHGETKMCHTYGYIRGTKGVDGDHVDVYVGPDKNAKNVFVIHQNKAPDFKEYDEDKVMLGFSSGKEAKEAYLKQYDKPGFYGGMTPMTVDEFKKKVKATKDRPQMIKSFTEKDTGPTVWHVTAMVAGKNPDEQAFGEWVHTHPQVEHDQQWAAFKDATRIEDPPRSYMTRDTVDHLADEEEHGEFTGGEDLPPEGPEDQEPDDQELGDQEPPGIDDSMVAKALLVQMMGSVA